MVDWLSVLLNGFWIVGAAIILAAFSYYYWEAQHKKKPLRQVLGRRAFQQFLLIGLLLIGIGLAATSQELIQAIPAGFLIIGCIVSLVLLWRAESAV